jgi:hypothetical protein
VESRASRGGEAVRGPVVRNIGLSDGQRIDTQIGVCRDRSRQYKHYH